GEEGGGGGGGGRGGGRAGGGGGLSGADLPDLRCDRIGSRRAGCRGGRPRRGTGLVPRQLSRGVGARGGARRAGGGARAPGGRRRPAARRDRRGRLRRGRRPAPAEAGRPPR